MESIGRYSAAVYRLTQSIFSHKLRELEFGSGQYDFFLIISRHEGISQKELSDRLYVEKSTTAKAVKYLSGKGYITNRKTGDDKRYSALFLTEKGRKAAEEVEAVFSDILEVFSKDIPDGDMDQTVETMKKVIGNLQEEKAKLSANLSE
jgi:DNA-binding MarR family transcriptional regulator